MGERRIVKGWIVERGADGSLVPIAPAGGQAGPPRDPTFDLQAPKVQTEIAQGQAGIGKTQADTVRTKVQTEGDTLANATAVKNLRQNPISEIDQKFINDMRAQTGDTNKLLRDVTGAQVAVDRFGTAPGRGTLYGMGTADDSDYPITAAAKGLVGMFLPDQKQEEYQRLVGLQNDAVLNTQIAQKGPQTESDAIRMKLANVSPNKNVRVNSQILADGQYEAMMAQQRPGFFTFWANKFGSLNALNPQGKSAEQVWNESYQQGLSKMRQDGRYNGRAPRRGQQGGSNGAWWDNSTGRAPRRSNSPRVIDFNDLP